MKRIGIITGATGGLGKEFVKLLIKENLDEVWCIARNIDRLNELKKLSDKIVPISLDLSKADSFNNFELLFNDVDVVFLINNASIGKMDKSENFSLDEIDNTIDLNIKAMVKMINITLPYMNKGSHIVNLSSQSSFQPVPYINLYASTKAFERNYSLALGRELKGRGISVTCVTPGWVKTEMLLSEYNGVKVKFPHLALPEKVATKAIKDAKKNKRYSVYSLYVKFMHLLSKLYSTRVLMNCWMFGIRKYIK